MDATTPEFETLESLVRRHVAAALTLAQGNQREAASLLGVSRWTAARMVKRLGLGDLVTTLRGREHPALRMPPTDVPEETRWGHEG